LLDVENRQVEIVQWWPVKAYAGGAIVATLPDPSKATMRRAISRLFTTAFYCRDRCLSNPRSMLGPFPGTSDEGRKNEMSTPIPRHRQA